MPRRPGRAARRGADPTIRAPSPVSAMFKNVLVYRISTWEQPDLSVLEERLAGARFVECGASQLESAGWVEPRGEKHGVMVESVGGQWILRLCTERKAVPGSVVK